MKSVSLMDIRPMTTRTERLIASLRPGDYISSQFENGGCHIEMNGVVTAIEDGQVFTDFPHWGPGLQTAPPRRPVTIRHGRHEVIPTREVIEKIKGDCQIIETFSNGTAAIITGTIVEITDEGFYVGGYRFLYGGRGLGPYSPHVRVTLG